MPDYAESRCNDWNPGNRHHCIRTAAHGGWCRDLYGNQWCGFCGLYPRECRRPREHGGLS